MALLHNAFIFSVFLFLVVFLTTVQTQRNPNINRKQLRPTRGFQEMELSVARGWGKRAVNTQVINNFLLKWFALETKMRSLRMAQQKYGIHPPSIQ